MSTTGTIPTESICRQASPVMPYGLDPARRRCRPRRQSALGAVLIFAAITGSEGAFALAVGRIAGQFGVDPAGAATYVVPITVAAGAGDLHPTISLRYNSHDSDGLAGVGWTLGGLSRISRCPLTIAVDNRVQGVKFGASDRFCLDGQPLILIAGSYGADGAEYRTEIDSYQRVLSRGRAAGGPAWFEVQQPDGTTRFYGNDDDSRIEAAGTGEVREWAINQIADSFQNQILFAYTEDQVGGEYQPNEIRWTVDATGSGAKYRLAFIYETRPAEEVRSGHLWGSPWQRSRRLQAIRYEVDGGTGFAPVHTYALSYSAAASGSSHRSQLERIQQCAAAECLPATVLGWQNGVSGFADAVAGPTDADAGSALLGDWDGDGDADIYVPINAAGGKKWHIRRANPSQAAVYGSTPVNTGVPATGPGYLLDFDGDGRRDLLTYGPASPYKWFVYRSDGSTGFLPGIDTGIDTGTMPYPALLDMDGDGLDDLVYARTFSTFFRRNTGAGFGPEQPTSIVPVASALGTSMPGLDTSMGPMDFDGDGRQDLLIRRMSLSLTGPPTYFEGFLSTGSDFVSVFTTAPATEAFALDLNGDGLSDLAYRDRTLGWQTRVSTGNGLAPPQPTEIKPTDAMIVRATDYDGDGRDDLIRQLDDLTWRVHLSSGSSTGQAFSNTDPARYINLPGPGPGPAATARLASLDVTGDGYADLVFTQTNGQWQVRRRSGPRADLLTAVTDGLGNTWQPAYQPLATFAGYTKDSSNLVAGTWLMRGGPMEVVASYAASDGAGGTYTTNYAYWNARSSRLGRGFLGFEKVRASDSRYAPLYGVEVYSESVYRQDFPFIGALDLVTTARADGRKIAVTNPTWASRLRPAAATDPAADYHFSYVASETREEYETDPDGGSLGQLVRTTSTNRVFDFNHGVPVQETTTVGSPQSTAVFNTTTTMTLDDAPRLARYCLGLPLRTDITRDISGAGTQTRTVQATFSAANCRQQAETVGPVAVPAKQLTTSYSYNAHGQLTATIQSPGDGSQAQRQTIYTYDPGSDRPRSETMIVAGQASPVTQHEWDYGLDLELRRINPRGLATRWTYDGFGRLRQETPPDGPASTLTYLACGGTCFAARGEYRIRTSRSDGFTSDTVHDSYGRTVGREFALTGGKTSRQLTEYDALGRVRRESVPFIAGASQYWLARTYDLAGRLTDEDRPVDETTASGATTHWTFNRLTTTVEDAENHLTTNTYDPGGHLISVASATGGTALYGYTPFGEIASITDPNGSASSFIWDERGFLTVANSPDTGRRISTFNSFGELTSQTDAKSPANTIAFAYDQLARLVERNDPGEGITSWTFNTASGPGLGLLQKVTGPAGFSEQYGYDPLGRRTAVTTSLDGASYLTNFSYDALGRLATMTYPTTVNGARPLFRYGYDAAGYLDVVEQDVAGGGGMWLRLYDLRDQDALARETWATLGSSSTVDEQHIYDRASTRLREIRTGPGLGARLQNYLYQWDRTGNLRQRQDLNQGLTEQFGYDDRNRLTSATLNGTQTVALGFDAGGRIRTKSDTGIYTYGSSHPGAVTAISGGPRGAASYAYDANGNMTTRSGKSITWTSYNLPRHIDFGTSDYAEFSYGPARQRIRQVARAGAVTRTTYYIGPHFELEVEGSNRRYRSNVFARGQVFYSQVEQASPAALDAYFLHRDHQGSVDALTRAVGNGSDSLALRFDAFVKRRNANWSADPADQRFGDSHWTERGYTGHEHLDNLRLVHMNGRLQDPMLGAMLSPDPLAGDLASPQTLNRYGYVAGNPTSYIDADGFFLSGVGNFLKRSVHGAGSFIRRVIHDYGREIVAAVAAYYTAGLVSEAYLGGVAGASAAAGDTLGAIAGGAAAGAISTGDARGVLAGAVAGGAFGAVQAGYGGNWTAGRVLTQATVGGVAAEINGGDFRQGFIYSGIAGGARYAYNELVSYDTTWGSGSAAQAKGRFQMPYEGTNNFGAAVRVIDPDAFWGEGGQFSRFMNRIPGMNAIAGMHDVFQVGWDRLGGGFLRSAMNYPGMPVAAVLTYPALLDGVPAVMIATD